MRVSAPEGKLQLATKLVTLDWMEPDEAELLAGGLACDLYYPLLPAHVMCGARPGACQPRSRRRRR